MCQGNRCSANPPVTWAWQDDDSNFHMDFVVAATELRAQNYGILPLNHAQVTPPLWGSAWKGGPNLKPIPDALSLTDQANRGPDYPSHCHQYSSCSRLIGPGAV